MFQSRSRAVAVVHTQIDCILSSTSFPLVRQPSTFLSASARSFFQKLRAS
jgi:hypothetical protein